MANTSSGFFTWLDRSKEKATFSYRVEDIGDDGANYASVKADMALLKAALEAVTDGVISEGAIVANRTRYTNTAASDGRREDKWLVRYEDMTTKRVYTWELPCADEASLPMQDNSDFVQMTGAHAARDALVAELEKLLSPYGNEVNVLSIEIVGRNT